MVLAGNVIVAGCGRIQGRSVWNVSVGLVRRVWWHPFSSQLRPRSRILLKVPPPIRSTLTNDGARTSPSSSAHPGSSRDDRREQLNSSIGGANGYVTPPGLHVKHVVRATSRGEERELIPRDPVALAKDQLERNEIFLLDYSPGEQRVFCPKCEGGSSREKSLSVKIDPTGFSVWNCFRGKCGFQGPRKLNSNRSRKLASESSTNGATRGVKALPGKPEKLSIKNLQLNPDLSDGVKAWFFQRGISSDTLEKQKVMEQRMFTGNGANDVVIVFPYMRDDDMVNCKYRSVDKKFWQVKGAEKVFYGLNDIKNQKDIIIVEGEIDKLSFYEAGFPCCVSVPDGAPSKVSDLPSSKQDKKFEYLFNCQEYLQQATRIVLATDADEPGQALAEELARRLGRERCWRVKWPVLDDGTICKDANEVLYNLGPEGIRHVIDTAELYPIRGLFKFSHFFKEIDDYYFLRLGDERGVSTGWSGLDDFYRVVPGELTIITGVPNSGKSEWIDALLCNLNRNKGWSFALCSMENKVREHGRKLLEKYLKLPFFDAPYANNKTRMSKDQLDEGKQWLNENFFLIRCEDDELPSVDWVLNLAKAAVMRHGIRGLVIDPYNELDHQRPSSQTETEYVSQMLTRVKRFAQHHDCHVWFVAHPKQLQVWKGEAPGLYDISGSAHFINKCDNGIVIHRNRDPEAGTLDQVKVLVRKVRNKAAGTIGEASLQYNKVTGEYVDCI